MEWIETNSLLKGIFLKKTELSEPVRVAAFDLDDTIIYRASRKKDNKWSIIDKTFCDKIKELVDKNYLIAIFSNQSGLSKSKNADKLLWRKALKEVFEFMFSKTDKKCGFFYAAKQEDIYRKPNIGMWLELKKDIKEKFDLDQDYKLQFSKKSFFCGDAAGRTKPSILKRKINPKNKKGDFSDSDRKFALNVGLKFMTPEEFYLGKDDNATFKLSGFDPNEYLNSINKQKKIKFVPRKKEMIMMIGPPASGKSSFVKKYILDHGYEYINQDTCKTKSKCLKLATDFVGRGVSFVVDNTNIDVKTRFDYLYLAKKAGYKHIRAIIIDTPLYIAEHMSNVRHLYSGGHIKKIPKIVYFSWRKYYIEPFEKEFDLIEKIKFRLDDDMISDKKFMRFFKMWSESNFDANL